MKPAPLTPSQKKYIIAMSVLVFIVSISVSLAIACYLEKKFHNSNIYLNPALAVLEKKDLIVNFTEIRKYLMDTYENKGDYTVSIYFEYLPTGANISINKDIQMWPASLIKIPLALAVMKKVEDGIWKLDNELVMLDQDKDDGYGDMYKLPSGSTFTVEELLKKSLIDSDNTAHFIFLRNIEDAELANVYYHLGMDDVIDSLKRNPSHIPDDNRITAKRYSIFFRSLYNATFLNQEHSQLFLQTLEQAPNEYLALALPKDVPFVHKTGLRLDMKVVADSGIVYVPGRPYILTVMIEQKKDGPINLKEIQGIFDDVSGKVYSYVKKAD